MLAKLEDIYLNILRVAVLAAATLAVVVFAFSVIQLGPSILGSLGIAPPQGVSQANLGEFIRQSRGENIDLDATTADQPNLMPGELDAAASLVTQYGNRHIRGGVSKSTVLDILVRHYRSLPDAYQDRYAGSVLKFAEQLNASTGTPLNRGRLENALAWHAAQFYEAARSDEEARAENAERADGSLRMATISAGFFMFVIFFFVVVKIERNLRLVRTRDVDRLR